MLENILLERIHQLKLLGMLEGVKQLESNQAIQTLSLNDGLSLLLDHELSYRNTRRLARLTRLAKLRYPQAMIENINYEHKRAISADSLKWLTSGQWLLNHHNIILTGPTGIGKTYLACACAQLACRRGTNTRYFRLSKLLEAMRMAHADGSYSRLTGQLLKAQCLVIDDWGIDPISPERRADLLEVIDDHYDQRSVIIASQLPIEHWHEYIGDNTIADAILDRIIHRATTFKLNGESMRKRLDLS